MAGNPDRINVAVNLFGKLQALPGNIGVKDFGECFAGLSTEMGLKWSDIETECSLDYYALGWVLLLMFGKIWGKTLEEKRALDYSSSAPALKPFVQRFNAWHE